MIFSIKIEVSNLDKIKQSVDNTRVDIKILPLPKR